MQLKPYEWLAELCRLAWIVAAFLGIHGQDKLCEMILTQCMFLCSYNTRLTGHPYGQANIKSDKYQQACIREGYCHATWYHCRAAPEHISARWLIARAAQPAHYDQSGRPGHCLCPGYGLCPGQGLSHGQCMVPVLVPGACSCVWACAMRPPQDTAACCLEQLNAAA